MYSWICAAVFSLGFAALFSGLSTRSVELAAGLGGWGFFCSGLAFAVRLIMPSAKGARTLYMCVLLALLGLPIALDAVVTITASPRDLNPLALVNPLLHAALAGRYTLDWWYYFPVGAFVLGILLSLSAWPRLSRAAEPV
jgi:hypothetical protein